MAQSHGPGLLRAKGRPLLTTWDVKPSRHLQCITSWHTHFLADELRVQKRVFSTTVVA